MRSTSSADPVALLGAALDALADEDAAALPGPAVRDQLVELLAATNRLYAQVARRVATFEANGACVLDAARSARAWLRMAGRLSPPAAIRLVNAGRLLADLPALAEAVAQGEVSAEHVDRVARLAERVSPRVVASVEQPLTELARKVDPGTLERACARVRQHADPDGPRPDAREDFERRGITTSEFDGMLLVRGQLDPEGGAALQAALDALMGPPAPGDGRRAAQRRADALVELARGAMTSARLPEVGGARPQLGILLAPESLTGLPRVSRADQGDPLAAAGVPPPRSRPWLEWIGEVSDELAQRIACDADVWRVVLDPASGRPLDLGRAHRLVPAWLRKALYARDRGCRFPCCDAPVAWTDAHHLRHWARGGPTDADNLILLCRHHHVLVHEGGWSISRDPRTGEVTARRPGGTVFTPPRPHARTGARPRERPDESEAA